MAPDFINSKKIGVIVNTLDPKAIAEKIVDFLNTIKISKSKEISRKVIMKADWRIVSKYHLDKVYREVLRENR
jgi:hypothetical protein